MKITYIPHATLISVQMEGKTIGHIHPRVDRHKNACYQYVPKGKTSKDGGQLFPTVDACKASLEGTDGVEDYHRIYEEQADPQSKGVWLGMLDELGGYGRYVVAETEEQAKAALLKAWQDYDKSNGSDYHGQVHGFEDLAEIYGATVHCMPWNQYVHGMCGLG